MTIASRPGGTTEPDSHTPFVGREAELRSLLAGLERALAGQGQTLLVVGEPGIGKTRIVEEFAALAREQGVDVRFGRCMEWEGAPPYWPWLQVLRGIVRDADDATLRRWLGRQAADVVQLVPELRERFPELPEPPAVDPEQARFRLFEGVTAFLKHAASDQPLMLVLDDLHAADAPSLLLLRYLVSDIRDTRLLVVGTYRNVEVGRQHPLEETLTELARQQATQRVMLRGLSRGDIVTYMDLSTGAVPADALVTTVHDHTEGNPFFVTEVVRLLAEEGGLARGAGASWDVRVPESVRGVIGRRLRRLSADCNQVLSIASVIGREFTLTLLERVSEFDAGRLLDLLDEAVQAQIVQELPGLGNYRFSHMLIQETLYDELSTAVRVRLHGAVGDALEEFYAANRAVIVSDLARHFFQAAPLGRTEKAIAYSVDAAEQASAQLAWEEAARHYEQALQVLDLSSNVPPHQRCTLLLAVSQALFRSGDVNRAEAHFRRAVTFARQSGAFHELAEAAVSAVYFGVPAGLSFDETRMLLEELLTNLDSADSPIRARVIGNLAAHSRFVPDTLQRRRALSEEAVAMARRLGEPATLANALLARYWALWDPGNAEERLADATEAIELAVGTGHAELEINALTARHFALTELGDLIEADRGLEAATRLTDSVRILYPQWWILQLRSMQALLRGQFDDAERLILQARPIARRAQSQSSGVSSERPFLRHHFVVLQERGTSGELEQLVPQVVEQTPPSSMHSWEFNKNWRCLITLLLCEIGREADAHAEFERLAAHNFKDFVRDSLWTNSIAYLADVSTRLADRPRAITLHAMLEPLARLNVVNSNGTICFGPVSHYLGLLASTLERWDAADRHFADALAMNERMGARLFVVQTQHAWAEMLLKRSRPEDADQALALARAAHATASELGMSRRVERLRPLIDQLAGTPSGSATGAAFGLSPREMDVLRLLAAGRTDREIGETLFISHRTATTHVTNILGKLGVESRTAAATFAVRQGIV